MYDTGKLSTTTLLCVGPVPVFPTFIVNVSVSFTLAGEPDTAMVMVALVVNVPVNVGEGVSVWVGDGPGVTVDVGDGSVPVGVKVYVGP
jgi:hypothetical protein